MSLFESIKFSTWVILIIYTVFHMNVIKLHVNFYWVKNAVVLTQSYCIMCVKWV